MEFNDLDLDLACAAIHNDDTEMVATLEEKDPAILTRTHWHAMMKKEDYILAEQIRGMIDERKQ